MSNTIQYGFITISGYKLFVKPEDYTLTSVGTKSQLIPTSRGYYIDVGKGFYGFSIRTIVLDGNIIKSIESDAVAALENKTPMVVTDTVYPGGKTWTGFVELPVVKTGSLTTSGLLGLPQYAATEAMELTFIDTTLRTL